MKEDIFEGLKQALSKGESLQHAMQSFYNAGYNKTEINEAAKELQFRIYNQNNIVNTIQPKETNIQEPSVQEPSVPEQAIPEPAYSEIKIKPSVQKVSAYVPSYDERKNPRKIVIIIISILLVMLVLALIGIFFFREGILGFIDDLFTY